MIYSNQASAVSEYIYIYYADILGKTKSDYYVAPCAPAVKN